MKRFVATGVLVFALAAGAEERVLGAVLPSSAHKVAELRYRVSEDWDGINKFYRNTYPEKEYPRRNIVNQPGVKAFHIVNPSGRGWEGLNIYAANEEIRVYVVPAESTKTKGKKSGKK
jgi:hypothetical protein